MNVKTDLQTLHDLMGKVEKAERQNSELKAENLSLKRVSNVQGKALNKMVNENDYPSKFKNLMDELRFYKDKVRQLEE